MADEPKTPKTPKPIQTGPVIKRTPPPSTKKVTETRTSKAAKRTANPIKTGNVKKRSR